MANIKLIFQGTERSETHKTELQAYSNIFDEIFISMEDPENPHEVGEFICLDKETAIRLVRELKKHIGFINQNQ